MGTEFPVALNRRKPPVGLKWIGSSGYSYRSTLSLFPRLSMGDLCLDSSVCTCIPPVFFVLSPPLAPIFCIAIFPRTVPCTCSRRRMCEKRLEYVRIPKSLIGTASPSIQPHSVALLRELERSGRPPLLDRVAVTTAIFPSTRYAVMSFLRRKKVMMQWLMIKLSISMVVFDSVARCLVVNC